MLDHHDWQDPDYVREWVARSRSEDAARLPRFRLMADLVPCPRDAPIAILDVGAGYGPLTSAMLEAFPKSRVVALDHSEPMLAWARELLAPHAGRVAFVRADLASPKWTGAAGGPFEVVVSSWALHNLRSAPRIRAIFREVYGLLRPGGCFLDLDLVGAPSPEALRRYGEVWAARHHRDEAPARHGPDKSGMPASAYSFPASVEDELAWLREAGFTGVDCYWKELGMALVGGYT